MSTRRASSVASQLIRRTSRQASFSNSLIKAVQTQPSQFSKRFFADDAKKQGLFSRIVQFVKDEAANLQEVSDVIEAPPRVPKRRLLDDKAIPYCPPEVAEALKARDSLGHTVNFDELDLKEGEEDEEQEKGPSELATTKDTRTVWSKRVDTMKDNIHNSALYRTANKARLSLEVSDNAHIQKLMDLKYNMEDTVDDMRQSYETSQHPLIWKIKDAEERLSGETEYGAAVSELLKIDPSYSPLHLCEDLEQYMIPVIVTAFNEGNIDIIRSAAGDAALDALEAHIAERVKSKEFLSNTILNASNIDVNTVEIENNQPVVKATFIVHHVSCVTDLNGKVIRGSLSNIVSTFYVWSMVRDFTNPDFDWKIIDFKFQEMLGLEG